MGTKSLLFNRPISLKRKHNMKKIVDIYVLFAKKVGRSMVKFRGNLIITSYIKSNLTNSYSIQVTFRTCFFSPVSSFNDEKIKLQDYNRRITTRDNNNVQSHDQEESKLNSTINANSGAHTLPHDKIIKKSIQ